MDSFIFAGLVAILIYNGINQHGVLFTTWLLCALVLTAIYLFWIRVPKIIVKKEVFFFANVWIEYNRIIEMNLSEDGVLIIDDLENVYKLMITNQ